MVEEEIRNMKVGKMVKIDIAPELVKYAMTMKEDKASDRFTVTILDVFRRMLVGEWESFLCVLEVNGFVARSC